MKLCNFYSVVLAMTTLGTFIVPVDSWVVNNYTVQLRLFVDKAGLAHWTKAADSTDTEEMYKEIHSIFKDITDIYSSLIEHVDIRFNFEILNITILDKNLFEDGTHGNQAIKDFREWIAPSYKTHHYDAAMLMTGVRMRGGIGFGYTGRICTEMSLGLVPFSATFKDAIVWGHELGHILGAEHDYEKDSNADCYLDSGKIMSPNIRNNPRETNFVFSPCSGSYIRSKMELITKAGINCLLDGKKSTPASTFGTFISPDEICKRMFGRTSFADANRYKGDPGEICLRLHCAAENPGYPPFYSDHTWSPQGMKCGKNKACKKGKCVEDSNGSPFVSDECPLGDQQKTGYEFYWAEVCGDIDVYYCKYYAEDCCQTCNTTHPIYTMMADEVCETMDGAGSVLERGLYTTYGDELCKELKCIKGRKPHFEYKTYDTPDGMPCGKNKRCYKQKCVNSRHGDTVIKDDTCPFGDQDLKALGYKGSCSEQTNCLAWKNWCCKSCEKSP